MVHFGARGEGKGGGDREVIFFANPVAICTGPVHQSVFAIHTRSSLFLKVYVSSTTVQFLRKKKFSGKF